MGNRRRSRKLPSGLFRDLIHSVQKLIALITDFGTQDSFVGTMKGVICSINPKARMIDLNHEIPPQNIRRAAFELFTSSSYFPKETLFVTVVDPGVGSRRKILFLKTRKHFFLAPDNGVLSWVLEREKPGKIIAVENRRFFLNPVSHTFHGRDIFAPVAAYWSSGTKMEKFGTPVKSYFRLPFPKPRVDGKKIYGEVIAADRFGNLISNFPNSFAQKNSCKRLSLRIKTKQIEGISSSYASAEAGEALFIEGSHGFLEIAVRKGSASKKMNAREGDPLMLAID